MVLIGILLALYLLLVVLPKERLDEDAVDPPRRVHQDAGVRDGELAPGVRIHRYVAPDRIVMECSGERARTAL